MAIAALVLWLLTAAAGLWLLSSGKAAGRGPGTATAPAGTPVAGTDLPAPADAPIPADVAAAAGAPAAVDAAAASAAVIAGAGTPAGTPATAAAPAGFAAPPLTGDGRPPPVPRPRAVSPPGEHPLLEFAHPALALVGLACWLGFTFIHNVAAAWAAVSVLAIVLAAGLSWLAGSRRAARRHPDTARVYSPRLIALHGVAAATVVALTVLSALSAIGSG